MASSILLLMSVDPNIRAKPPKLMQAIRAAMAGTESVQGRLDDFVQAILGHVALTARPLNLADAPSHPLFSYRPETGEDPYSSFLGVPIWFSLKLLSMTNALAVKKQS